MTLKEAIDSGSPTAVEAALERPEVRSHINDPLPGGSFGQTALIAAAQHANREVIDVLLGAGADINQKSHWWAGDITTRRPPGFRRWAALASSPSSSSTCSRTSM